MLKIKVHATFAFIKDAKDQVLIIRRASHDSFPGRWELPGGGIDSGEDIKSSIEREVLEETGLRVKAIKPIAEITHKNSKGKYIIRVTFECRLVNTDDKLILSKDHDAYSWVNAAELLNADKDSPLYDAVHGILKKNGSI